MKLSIFYASALAAVASASNLRATIDSPSQFNDARISMVGLKQEADAEDLEIIGESLMAAINDMFTDPEMQAVTFEAKSGATVTSEVTPLKRCRRCAPDDDQAALESAQSKLVAATVVGQVGLGRCRRCAPDDDRLQTTLKELTRCRRCAPDDDRKMGLQEELNAKFCHKLRASVSKNFANVHDCEVEFFDETATDLEKPSSAASLNEFVRTMEAKLLEVAVMNA